MSSPINNSNEIKSEIERRLEFNSINPSLSIEDINRYKIALELISSIEELEKIGHMYADATVIILDKVSKMIGISLDNSDRRIG